jgi:recombinational DNA repair ATPase RecF
LGVDPLEAQIPQVVLFETPELALNKCAPAEARAFLDWRIVDLYGEQQTKTALEHFSRVSDRPLGEPA